jgi:hypothetical protein
MTFNMRYNNQKNLIKLINIVVFLILKDKLERVIFPPLTLLFFHLKPL